MLTETKLTLGALNLHLDPSGAAFLPDQATLIVADLHLEKGSAFARRGQMLPPYDTAEALARLRAVIQCFAPQTVISLGDAFHDEAGPKQMAKGDKDALMALTSAHDWLWIEGNHDPVAPLHLGGRSAANIHISGVEFRHEPGGPTPFEVSGHLHPKARLRVRGSHLSRACFAADARRLILPAFGAFTGGLNVKSDPFEGLLSKEFHAWLLGGERVHRISSKHLLADPKSWRGTAEADY